MKTFIVPVSFLCICLIAPLFAQPPGYTAVQEKRFVMEFRSQDENKLFGVELIVAKPDDYQRSPMELLERQVGLKWSGFSSGDVYRFDPSSRKWEFVVRRGLSTAETVVGEEGLQPRLGLKVSELQSGDVIICRDFTYVR